MSIGLNWELLKKIEILIPHQVWMGNYISTLNFFLRVIIAHLQLVLLKVEETPKYIKECNKYHYTEYSVITDGKVVLRGQVTWLRK